MTKTRAIERMAGVPFWPLGLGEAQAAVYVGLPVSRFRAAVAHGRLPQPETIAGVALWSRLALDAAFRRQPCDAIAPRAADADADPVAASIEAEAAARKARAAAAAAAKTGRAAQASARSGRGPA